MSTNWQARARIKHRFHAKPGTVGATLVPSVRATGSVAGMSVSGRARVSIGGAGSTGATVNIVASTGAYLGLFSVAAAGAIGDVAQSGTATVTVAGALASALARSVVVTTTSANNALANPVGVAAAGASGGPTVRLSASVSLGPLAGGVSAPGHAGTVSVTTVALNPDVTAPSVPDGLEGVALSATEIALTWNPSTDPDVPGAVTSGVKDYGVFRNSSLREIVTSPNTTYTDIGLSAGTTYNYDVNARDNALNVSGKSLVEPVTTPGDPPPPGEGIFIDDGFDDGTYTPEWSLSGNGRIQIQTAIKLHGTHAAKVIIDKNEDGAGVYRSELARQGEFRRDPLNTILWYGYAMYVPGDSDYIIDTNGPQDVVMQLHGGGAFSTILFIFNENRVRLQNRYQYSSSGSVQNERNYYFDTHPTNPISVTSLRGTWVRVVVQARWTLGIASGSLYRMWVNDVQHINWVDIPIMSQYVQQSLGPYQKLGVYKSGWDPAKAGYKLGVARRRVLYFDDYKRGGPTSSYDAVRPL